MRWKALHGDAWNSLDLPTLSTLAAVQESLTSDDLVSLAGTGHGPLALRRLRHVFNLEWSPYLAISPAGTDFRSARSYRFYHASLRDFFAGRIDRNGLLRAEEAFIEELSEATRESHSRISDFFLGRWGGLDAGLPTLFDPRERAEIDGYGLRHLSEHLEGAGRADDLHRLLRLEHRVSVERAGTVSEENLWFAARERVGQTEGYRNDLARAARLVQVADRPDIGSSRLKICIGLGIRYALISASLYSLARDIPPALIEALVEKGVWLPSQGLAYARALQPEERVRAFIGINSHLDDRQKEAVLREAMEVARGINPEWVRARLLAELGHVEEALEAARGIGDEGARAHALAALAPLLAKSGRVQEVLEAANGIGDERARALALAALAPAEEALGVAREIVVEWYRAHALAALAPRLTGLEHVQEALEVARGIEDERARALALAALAPLLAELGHMEEALKMAGGFGAEWARNQVLGALAPQLAALRSVEAAIEVVRRVGSERTRAHGLERLVPRLEGLEHLESALELAREIGDETDRAQALADLARRLAALGRVEEAVEMGRGVEVESVT
jgi:hypothetical protein